VEGIIDTFGELPNYNLILLSAVRALSLHSSLCS
jgi:hypothetical protein